MSTEVTAFMEYFRHRPKELCMACAKALEARPGVRLCRACLEVAGACLEAIRAEEARETAPPQQDGSETK